MARMSSGLGLAATLTLLGVLASEGGAAPLADDEITKVDLPKGMLSFVKRSGSGAKVVEVVSVGQSCSILLDGSRVKLSSLKPGFKVLEIRSRDGRASSITAENPVVRKEVERERDRVAAEHNRRLMAASRAQDRVSVGPNCFAVARRARIDYESRTVSERTPDGTVDYLVADPSNSRLHYYRDNRWRYIRYAAVKSITSEHGTWTYNAATKLFDFTPSPEFASYLAYLAGRQKYSPALRTGTYPSAPAPRTARDREASAMKKLLGVWILHWYINAPKSNLARLLNGNTAPLDNDDWSVRIANAAARAGRNALIKSALRDLFGESASDKEHRLMATVISAVLDKKDIPKSLAREEMKEWVSILAEQAAKDLGVRGSPFVGKVTGLLVDLHGRMKAPAD